LFTGKEQQVYPLYVFLLEQLRRLGSITQTTSAKAITLYTPAHRSFLVVQPKKQGLEVWFVLHRAVNEFPVYKVLRPSKNRFAHFVRLYQPADVDAVLPGWMEEAYKQAGNEA